MHTVWLMDATTAYNQMRAAAPYHTLGAALWRLGTEDPSLWAFFGKGTAATLPQFDPQGSAAPELRRRLRHDVSGRGRRAGRGRAADGRPAVHQDGPADGPGHGGTFPALPVAVRRPAHRPGGPGPTGKNTAKAIALTFDDGPDPRWTPQILDILHREHVPATFFVVGENAEAHPGLIQREWNEGMEIGNHSFTHPEMDRCRRCGPSWNWTRPSASSRP